MGSYVLRCVICPICHVDVPAAPDSAVAICLNGHRIAVAGVDGPVYEAEYDVTPLLRNLWEELHSYAMSVESWDAAEAQRWFENDWLPRIPNIGGCTCADHFTPYLSANSPAFGTAEKFFSVDC